MKEFDPFGWLERFFPARTLHLMIRAAVILVLLLFLIHRLISYGRYWFKPLWAVETLIFVVFLVSYAVRKDPVYRSRGVREIIIPLIGGVLPFALLFSPPHPLILSSMGYVYAVFIWMTVATCLTLWGLWTLRRSFSVTVEARDLMVTGPYQFIRHPVYLGEMLTAAAVTVFRFSLINVLFFILFTVIQLYRSKMEEKKLGRVFPSYSDYAAKVMWFWPYRSRR